MNPFQHFLFYLVAVASMAFILFDPGIILGGEAIIASIGFLLILVLSFWGIFEEKIWKYSLFACLVQLGYFLVDAGTSLFLGKSVWYALPQFVSFSITGLLFAYLFAASQRTLNAKKLTDFNGLFDSNPWIGFGLIVSMLAFGGMPGFNIFVGEYLIYSMLFELHPVYALLVVFASLIAFIFYFRTVFIIFSRTNKKVSFGVVSKAFILLLSLATILLGVVPFILFRAVELMV